MADPKFSSTYPSHDHFTPKKVATEEAPVDLKIKSEPKLVAQPAPQPVLQPVLPKVEKWRPLVQKYFGAETNNALKIMNAESGGNPKSHNLNHKTKDDSYGLFQINLYGNLAKGRPQGWQLLDPEFNIKYAAKMHAKQQWQPWSTRTKVGL